MAEGGLLHPQVVGEGLDAAPVGALGDADEDDLRGDDQHVAALEAGIREVRIVLRRAGRRHVDLEERLVAGERRVMGEERAREERLALARLGRHRGDHHAVADHDQRVALEEVVGERRQLERAAAERLGVGGARPLDQAGGELRRRQVRQARQEVRGDGVLALELGEQLAARRRARQHVGEQVLAVQHLDAGLPHHGAEQVVLVARLLAVEDVVEEELLHHRRRHPVDLPPGPVHQDAPQACDFGIDVDAHGEGERPAPSGRGRGLYHSPKDGGARRKPDQPKAGAEAPRSPGATPADRSVSPARRPPGRRPCSRG